MNALTIIRETISPRSGVYIGGYNIAPNVLLITADNYSDAWDAMCEHFADAGSLTAADDDTDPDATDTDGTDWVDGHGLMVTADLVLSTIRPAPRD